MKRARARRRTQLHRYSPAVKWRAIPAFCSMVGCTEKAIAAMKVSDNFSPYWVSQCLRHSKGHGKVDPEKVTR